METRSNVEQLMDARNTWENTWEHDKYDKYDEYDEYEPETEDDIQALADALAPDPWGDPHDIEYWVWNGERLVPASPAERDTIQEMERAQSVRRRLAQWEQTQRHDAQPLRIFVGLARIITHWRLLWSDGSRPTAWLHHQRHNER